ncbi:chitin binding peritrophin-A domain-containing protein [Streptomyces subrutilus]|uniref:chitin binding peritrophin-A domain-containing protein n=1 Tax=Streptomyces subrutilus TaxID=36818 RepID=UPI002E14BD30|nr:chitin binding domain-containing protein [Streptomyces subrutilus]
MITSHRAGLLTAAALLMAPAAVALAPASAQAATPPPVNRSICKNPGGYYQHLSDPRTFWQCDSVYRPTRHSCPEGLWFNQEARPGPICDWPDGNNIYSRAPEGPTTLTTTPARLQKLPLKVVGLKATLKTGLIGVPITFKSKSGKVLCTATTESVSYYENTVGAPSVATCDSTAGLLGTVNDLLLGYTATFAGRDGHFNASTANGTVNLL